MYFQGGEPVFTPDPALDPEDVPRRRARALQRVPRSDRVQPEDVVAEFAARPPRPRPLATPRLPTPTAPTTRSSTRATSAPTTGWSAASRTQSTYPILANDPHRAIERAVAALLGAPGRAGLERDRRRRAGAARRVDRPQRVRRVGPDDLRQRQRGPLRLRDQPGQPERVPLPGQLGGDAGRHRHDSGEGRAAGARSS